MTRQNRITTLAELNIGKPETVHNLTAVPLSGNSESSLDYILLFPLTNKVLQSSTCKPILLKYSKVGS